MTDLEKTYYNAAVDTFLVEPEALTDVQIDLMTRASQGLGERARKKRQDHQTKAAEARHRAAMGQPPVKTKAVEGMADTVLDLVTLSHVAPHNRIKALEAANEAWEQRYRALETRLLELEARSAEIHAGR